MLLTVRRVKAMISQVKGRHSLILCFCEGLTHRFMMRGSALIIDFKRGGQNQIFYIFLISCMEQPRTFTHSTLPHPQHSKKRNLPPAEDSDFQQPSPTKKLAKAFQNSVAFTDANNSRSKPVSLYNPGFYTVTDKNVKESQDINFITQLRKSQKNSSNDKISRMKRLLPKHLTTNLSPEYQNMLKMASEIDTVLSKKSAVQYMESFQNIKNEIKNNHQYQLSIDFFKQLSRINKGLYKFYRDPLKNIVIGLPNLTQSLTLRRYNLRKLLFCYALNMAQSEQTISEISSNLPEVQLQIVKTQLFFPNISKKMIKKPQTLLKPQFIHILQNQIKQKQSILPFSPTNLIQPNSQQMITFISSLLDLFHTHKVTSIFRVNIIQWFLKQNMNLQLICTNLQRITQTGLLLHPLKLPNKSIIYKLYQHEHQTLLALLQKKRDT